MKTLYEILGIAQNATNSEIRKAYLALVKITHPDHNPAPNANEQFQVIFKAHNVLINEASRRNYDATLNQNVREESDSTNDEQPPANKGDSMLCTPWEAREQFNALLKRSNKILLSKKQMNDRFDEKELIHNEIQEESTPDFVKESRTRLYKEEINDLTNQNTDKQATALDVALNTLKDNGTTVVPHDMKQNIFFDRIYNIKVKDSDSKLYCMYSSTTGLTRIIADKWDEKTIVESARTWNALGNTKVMFIPEGEPGEIPKELRSLAVKIYELHNIKVVNPPGVEQERLKSTPSTAPSNLSHLPNKPQQTEELDSPVSPKLN